MLQSLVSAAALLALCSAQSTSSSNTSNTIGYNCYPDCVPSTIPANETSTFTFGKYYAVLNLDASNTAVSLFANTTKGGAWISNLEKWVNAVHAQKPPPLSIYTTVASVNARRPELGSQTGHPVPFAVNEALVGVQGTKETQIYPKFAPNTTAGDVLLSKDRYYAGAGNQLEEILSAQRIDTVILSGIATGGAVLSTALRLFDLDYKVYVIANNTLEVAAKGDNQLANTVILENILPGVPVDVISIEQAMDALKRSGPAVY